MNIAVIPARGGSKRIPHKNRREFLGKPLISYSITAALESKLFEKVVVSTDCEKIKVIAEEYGAEVPFLRAPELSDDITPTIPVLLDALHRVQKNDVKFDNFCLLYSNPFNTPENIRQAFEILISRKVASVIPVTTYSFPIFRSFKINEAGAIEFLFKEYSTGKSRTQDLPEAFYDTGQFYWCNAKRFFQKEQILQEDTLPCFLPRYLAQDLDTLEDWYMAEKLYKAFVKGI